MFTGTCSVPGSLLRGWTSAGSPLTTQHQFPALPPFSLSGLSLMSLLWLTLPLVGFLLPVFMSVLWALLSPWNPTQAGVHCSDQSWGLQACLSLALCYPLEATGNETSFSNGLEPLGTMQWLHEWPQTPSDSEDKIRKTPSSKTEPFQTNAISNLKNGRQ